VRKKTIFLILVLTMLLTLAVISFAAGAGFKGEPVYGQNLNTDREGDSMNKINVSFNGYTYPATLADNSSAAAFAELLQDRGGSVTIHMSDYGSFEKVGALGADLPRNDQQITTAAGDIILYQGNQITIYYAQNSWSFTRLGRLDDPAGLLDALGNGDADVTFALEK